MADAASETDTGGVNGTDGWSMEEAAARLAQADADGRGPSDDDEDHLLDEEDELDLIENDLPLDDLETPAADHGPQPGLTQAPRSDGASDVHTVKVDGHEQGVTLDELKAGYQRQADYTRKTQSLADERRQLQAERTQYQQMLASLAPASQDGFKAPAGPPDQALFDKDPAEYIRQSQQWQARQQVAEAASREQARLQALTEQENAVRVAERQRLEDSRLAQAVPGWQDPVTRQSGKTDVANYLVRSYGATPEELDTFSDHRLVVLAHKALAYDKLMSNRDLVHKKVRDVPQVQVPGAARSRQEVDAATVKAMRDRFHKTGSIDDAAKLMRYLGG